jgi:hypothetical protein
MTEGPPIQRRVSDTAEDINRLLSRLDADPVRVGEKYEEIRRRLIKFFECKRCLHPEELADHTLDRVGKKLASEEIHNISAYAIAVARIVLLESWRIPEECPIEDDGQHAPMDDADPELKILEIFDDRTKLISLRLCLRELNEMDRSLVLAYYSADAHRRVDHRRRLAERSGRKLNALRVHMNRIREMLESCVRRRLDERSRRIKMTWDRRQKGQW